ncbi:alpha/beta fold hydrolase [Sphingorhabdus sp. EL138]|uniref:alpha/beta fold hydrolase n=1 Tax=Sphingorhabdus sp. EL138 TaxID=2073156 RepID=UPI001C1FBDA8|nr:alpha/beta hydrolase [Sphingorhabdus sp. EL138]
MRRSKVSAYSRFRTAIPIQGEPHHYRKNLEFPFIGIIPSIPQLSLNNSKLRQKGKIDGVESKKQFHNIEALPSVSDGFHIDCFEAPAVIINWHLGDFAIRYSESVLVSEAMAVGRDQLSLNQSIINFERKMMNFYKTLINLRSMTAAILLATISAVQPAQAADVNYGYEDIEGTRVFFREAGDPSNPAIVLLHGFPSSSHQYRNLIRELSDKYYLIAPDYPGFGASDYPSASEYKYNFDNFAKTINSFLEQKGIAKYSLFIQDYGSPVGMRIATKHPERVQALIVQNGNIYEEGLAKEAWGPIMKLWEVGRGNTELETAIASQVFGLDGLKWQYTHGTRNPDNILPDNWLLDFQSLSRPGQHDIQLGLFYDYRNNVAKYPEWQAYLRKHQPSVLIVWAKNDAFFPVPGAEGFKRDVKDLDYNILDTGHFALEEDSKLIASKIRAFLDKRGIK